MECVLQHVIRTQRATDEKVLFVTDLKAFPQMCRQVYGVVEGVSLFEGGCDKRL